MQRFKIRRKQEGENPDDDGKTDLLFAIAAPQNGSLHVDMLARMMQMLMNEDFVEKLRTAKTPKEFLDCIDQQEQDQPQS